MDCCSSSFQNSYFWWTDEGGKAKGEKANYHIRLRAQEVVVNSMVNPWHEHT